MAEIDINKFCITLSSFVKYKISKLKNIPTTEEDQIFHCMLTNLIACIRHFDSIRILCENNYYEDAIALKRNLFETVLNIASFQDNPINAAKWLFYSSHQKDKIYEYGEIISECKKYNINFDEIKDIFYIKNNTLKFRTTWLNNKPHLAKKVNLHKEYYRSYKFAHPFVHGSGEYHRNFLHYDLENNYVYLRLNPNPPSKYFIPIILLDTSLLFLKAFEFIGKRKAVLNIQRLNKIDEAINKRLKLYIELDDKLDEENI
jgi:hypothetical protein